YRYCGGTAGDLAIWQSQRANDSRWPTTVFSVDQILIKTNKIRLTYYRNVPFQSYDSSNFVFIRERFKSCISQFLRQRRSKVFGFSANFSNGRFVLFLLASAATSAWLVFSEFCVVSFHCRTCIS